MSLGDQQPVQRQVRPLALQRPGQAQPGESKCLLAPVAFIDDRVAGEDHPHRRAVEAALVDRQRRKALHSAVVVAQQDSAVLAGKVAGKQLPRRARIVAFVERIHRPPLALAERRGRQHLRFRQ